MSRLQGVPGRDWDLLAAEVALDGDLPGLRVALSDLLLAAGQRATFQHYLLVFSCG